MRTHTRTDPCGGSMVVSYSFSPTAESFGVSAQIDSGVVRGDPEVRFHQGSTRVPPGFHEGATRVPPKVLRGLRGAASTKKSTACCWGCHLRFFFGGGSGDHFRLTRRFCILEQVPTFHHGDLATFSLLRHCQKRGFLLIFCGFPLGCQLVCLSQPGPRRPVG